MHKVPKQLIIAQKKEDEFEKQLRYSVREFMDYNPKQEIKSISLDMFLRNNVDKDLVDIIKYDNAIITKYNTDLEALDSKVNKIKNEIISKVNSFNIKEFENINKNNLVD